MQSKLNFLFAAYSQCNSVASSTGGRPFHCALDLPVTRLCLQRLIRNFSATSSHFLLESFEGSDVLDFLSAEESVVQPHLKTNNVFGVLQLLHQKWNSLASICFEVLQILGAVHVYLLLSHLALHIFHRPHQIHPRHTLTPRRCLIIEWV